MVSFGFSALGASVVDNMSRRAVDCISATNATYAARHADLTARHSTHSMCGIHVEEDIAKPEHSFPAAGEEEELQGTPPESSQVRVSDETRDFCYRSQIK